ncbi:hypothetical protein LE181_23080 [Streptomyces sp. SCA3-4]|uniref:DUF6881 domain-containing protein n=1 Tax=Streptomyces sichuanensis TaxID=2871810 RepID=UPI001CE378BF|nr:hypothetical protein [Streptomyces sichuanensis]MCA6095042.1 hypothetical protein [Streptomyces sichuanensis]
MEYWSVVWHHDFAEEPILLLSEVGEDGYENRKVVEFRDGRLLKADGQHEGRMVGLSEIPVGAIEEVAAQPEFSAQFISRHEFEEAWARAVWPD